MPITDFTADVYRAGGYRSSNSHYSIPGRDYVPSRDNKYQEGTQEWLEEEFAKSGLPKSYYDQFMNNSFYKDYLSLGSNHGFNSILHGLGFRTGLDKDRLDLLAKAREYTSGLLDTYRKEKYESPIQAAARENAAGLNSNMLGLDQAGSTPSMPEDTDPFNPNGEIIDPFSAVSSAASVLTGNPILSFAQEYLSLKQGFANLHGTNISNNNSLAKGYVDVADYARAVALDSITPDDFLPVEGSSEDGKQTLRGSVAVSNNIVDAYAADLPPQYRSVFRKAFNQHRSSVFVNHKSWDDFASMRESQLRSDVAENDMANGITLASWNLKYLRTQIDAKYAKLEQELVDNPDFSKIWKESKYEDLKRQLSESKLVQAESDFQGSVWRSVGQDTEAHDALVDAIKQEFIKREKEAIASQHESDLKTADLKVIEAFNTYLMENGQWSTNSAYDLQSKNRSRYRSAASRQGGYIEYLPVTLDDFANFF